MRTRIAWDSSIIIWIELPNKSCVSCPQILHKTRYQYEITQAISISLSKKWPKKKLTGRVRKKRSQSSVAGTMMPIYSYTPLHIFIYTCTYSYFRYSKLSQGRSWGNVKLDLKQIGMKEKKDEDTHTRDKRQSVGRRKWKIIVEYKGPSDNGWRKLSVCCCCGILVTVWKSSLSTQCVGSGNQKLMNVR